MKSVAKALLTDGLGNVLLLKRSMTHPRFPGHFDLPGGEVEEGESLSVAVAREIFEELGIHIDTARLEKVLEIPHPTVLHALYTTKLDEKRPRVTLSWEHSDYQWLSVEELLRIPLPTGVDHYYIDAVTYLRTHPKL